VNSIYIVTWTVLDLLKQGKMQELVEHIASTQLEIAAIQETKLSGDGLIKRNNYSLWI